MFATATKNFVEEVDRGGLLVPVSSLNDNVVLLSLVIKRRRFWFWQKTKYLPTDFTLNDVLSGDTPLKPVVIEADFIKYNGTFGVNVKGNVEGRFVHCNVNLEGKDASKLQSSFGSLKKEEVDVQKLLRDSKDRVLDMSHCLIQQTKDKHKEVFGLVKERIVTTQTCSVIEEVQQGGQLGGLLSFCGLKASKVSLKENGSLSKDSNVTMEIPPHTVIAYGLIELEVKLNGHYELCLMSDTDGGFEVDGPAKGQLVGVSCGPEHTSKHNCLKTELDRLSSHFQLLSSLNAPTRSSLLQLLAKAMEDGETVGPLENVLGQMCLGPCPALGDVQVESGRRDIQDMLALLEKCTREEQPQTDDSTSVVFALYLIISALDEMTDDCLAVLGTCCSPTVLQTLELLVQCATGSGEVSLSSADLAPVNEEIYEKTQHLFASSNVTLKRDGDTVKTEIDPQPGNRPLVLCIAVRGLASLAHGI
ncbi:gasdermin-E-like [Polymixia lowei]